MSTAAEQARDLTRYTLLLRVLALPIVLYTLWQSMREGGWRYLRERLGQYRNGKQQNPIWLHAASVGEVNAALPLIDSLLEHHPGTPLLLTTSTPSGAKVAAKKLPSVVQHAFFPIDWPGAVRRFIRRYQPRCALVMETELWPNLYHRCHRENIPLLIVNGRLSPRTKKVRPWLRRLYTLCLQQVTAVLARSEQDRICFITLGADRERCETIGNIKFAAAPRTQGIEAIALKRPYLLAASTREGEEQLVVEAWRKSDDKDHLLVIVPRHPKRLSQILEDLKGEKISIRSRGEALTDSTTVYLADTFGELPGFIAGADVVFMGGSLVPKGGQNLLEAAALGRAPLFGPHMDNFLVEADVLLNEGGAIQVENEAQLAEAISRLLNDSFQREEMGRKAREAVDRRRDMAERYHQALDRYCDLAAS